MFEPDGVPCLTQRVLARMGTWHLLVGCLMLNKTERRQAWRALELILARAQQPEDLASVDDEYLADALRPCGFGNRRLAALRALTDDWLAGVPVEKIRHVGKYALDSYAIFRLGGHPDPGSVTDKQLRLFLGLEPDGVTE